MRLSCGTCGADFEVENELAAHSHAVTCPSCGSSVALQATSLELAVETPAVVEVASEDGDFDSPVSGESVFEPSSVRTSSRVAGSPAESSRLSYQGSIRSSDSSSSWARWTVLVALLFGLALYVVRHRSQPAERVIANPIRNMVSVWRDQGVEALEAGAAVKEGRRALDGGRSERIRGFRLARRALVDNPDSASAIALYAESLAKVPSARSQGRVALALQSLTAAIGENPSTPDLVALEVARAWLLLEAGSLDAARDAARRANELDSLSLRVRLVLAATDAEVRPVQAVEALERLVEHPRLGSQANRWLGSALVRSGRVHEGLRQLRDAVTSAHSSDEVERRLYQLYFSIGEDKRAAAHLNDLAESGRASLEDRVRYARYLSRVEGQTEQALQVLRDGLEEPVFGTFSVAKVFAEMVLIASTAKGFVPDSRELSAWLDEGLRLDPDSSMLMYGSSLADAALDRDEQALNNLEVANGLNPDVPEMAVDLAFRLRSQDPAAAREVVDDALASNFDSIGLFAMSAILAFDEGTKVRAFREVRRALNVDPEMALRRGLASDFPAPLGVYKRMGDVLFGIGKQTRNAVTLSGAAAAYYLANDFRQVGRALTQALRLDRWEATANLYAGILAKRRKQKGAARKAFATAWERGRALPLVRLYNARMHEATGSYEMAERLYRELLHVNASSAPAQVGLARVLWHVGRKNQALDEAQKVLEVSPNDFEALSFLANLGEGSRRLGRSQ